ncbi:MAG: hypothetical protein A3G34_03660 [Candidatus Lindowbacteria bacterium RIFCSPLOWO2_12_FULL_62_27]|nr:MAG: hypothetical protein A3G34_03660 [Candidatus Lindowbacteria bacterium RIFCSPLOWO2_12_FULL_62_27]OGH61830.1 MAG: hypothetical protein A3I06_09445 [Candidatus Lindowbacteria bacterium RIFCSPLOWO2_02_FULL_62_12]
MGKIRARQGRRIRRQIWSTGMDPFKLAYILIETFLFCLTFYYATMIRNLFQSAAVFCVFNAVTWIVGFVMLILKNPGTVNGMILAKMQLCLIAAAGFLLGAYECIKRGKES